MTAPTGRGFPDGFLWGVAGAGHQIEGDNVDSDTWFAEHVEPTVFREPSGAACNSYELWREDIELAAGMSLNAYRFSLEWARIEPTEGSFSSKALDHYEAILDECLTRGLAPVVTFNHFTSPRWFAERGSWLDPEAPELFARYCHRVMERFGAKIAFAVTLNEPNLTRLLSWLNLPDFVRQVERATLDAASSAAGVERFRLSNVMLPEEMDAFADGMTAGHLAGRAAIKSHRADLPVGLALAIMDDVVVGSDPTARDAKRADCYERWLELANGDDFVGVQNYERIHFGADGQVEPPEHLERNQMGSAIEPMSLAGAVRYAYDATRVPVLVTEHGISTADDRQRVAFIPPSLRGLLDAIDDGVPVVGYCHWTLLDNFEWVFGYAHQLGLHEVDRVTFARTPKPSARVYAAIAAAHAVTS
jgi:beta-glucosidase